jgi:hypothetical protein
MAADFTHYSRWETGRLATRTYESKHIILDETYPAGELVDEMFVGKDIVGFHIRGRCPACFHETSAVCATRYLAQDRSPAEDGRDRYMYTTLKCACIIDHPKNPATPPFGCGAEWMLKVSYSEKTLMRPEIEIVSAIDARYRWAAADVNGMAIPDSLTTFQTAAGKWQAALTALVALVGVGSLLTGRSTVQALTPSWQWLLAIALGLAILFDAAMLCAGDLASFGFPSLRSEAQANRDLLNADLAPLKSARKAEHQLWYSFVFAGLTVLASIAVIAILLFVATPNPAATYKITYTQKDSVASTTSCGTFSQPLPVPPEWFSKRTTFTPDVTGAHSLDVRSISIKSIVGC